MTWNGFWMTHFYWFWPRTTQSSFLMFCCKFLTSIPNFRKTHQISCIIKLWPRNRNSRWNSNGFSRYLVIEIKSTFRVCRFKRTISILDSLIPKILRKTLLKVLITKFRFYNYATKSKSNMTKTSKLLPIIKSLWLSSAFANRSFRRGSITHSSWFTSASVTSSQRYGWVGPCSCWICVLRISRFCSSRKFRNISFTPCISSVARSQSMSIFSILSNFCTSNWLWSTWPWTWLMRQRTLRSRPMCQR